MLFRVDEVLLIINEGVHIVNKENEQHLTVLLPLQSLQVQHTQNILIYHLLLTGIAVVVYQVMLEICLNELDCMFIFWLENAIGEDLQENIHLQLIRFEGFSQFHQDIEDKIESFH